MTHFGGECSPPFALNRLVLSLVDLCAGLLCANQQLAVALVVGRAFDRMIL